MSSSRRRDETGRFLPAIDIQDGDSTSEFLPAPTPTSNPAEDSRIARPADDFDARTRASVAPMFEQLLNRLDAMETRMTARSTRSSPERGPPLSPRHSEFTYADDRRRHDDDEAGIQRALKQLKDGIKMRWDTKPMTLKRTNFLAWKEAMMADARLIGAHTILTGGQREPPTGSTRLESEVWRAKDFELSTRMWRACEPEMRETLSTFESQGSVDLLEQITNLVGVKRSRERYDLIREWLTLKIENNDFASYQAKFKRIEAKIKNLNITVQDMLHDAFLQNLGSYQSAFVNSRLDEFFATGSRHEPIQNLDLDDLIRQLNNRSRDIPKPKNASMYQSPIPIKDTKDDSNKPRRTCEYCGIPFHGERNCRSKHPESAPIDWLKENINRVNDARGKNGDELYQIRGISKPTAMLAINTTAVNPTSRHWRYDTCASLHIVNDRRLFTSYQPLNDPKEMIGGMFTDGTPVGVGNIQLTLDSGLKVMFKNARHIPDAESTVLSQRGMVKEGYKASYHEIGTGNLTYFKIRSPQGQIFFAAPDASETYRLTGTKPNASTPVKSATGTSFVLEAPEAPTSKHKSTSAEPSKPPRRTNSSEEATEDIGIKYDRGPTSRSTRFGRIHVKNPGSIPQDRFKGGTRKRPKGHHDCKDRRRC